MTERAVTMVGSRAAVHLARRYATDAEDLWSAITEPERAARWLGVVTGELREGGEVRLCMSPPDSDVAMLDVLRCDRPRRLVARWKEEGRPHAVVDAEIVELADGGCELRLEHLAIDDIVDYGCGWEDFLAGLEQFLGGEQKPSASWEQVRAALGPSWDSEVERATVDRRWPTLDDGTIRVEHTVAADPPAVWAALTEPNALAGWFATVSGDLSTGGAWTATFDGGGCSGVVRECDDAASFTTSWRWDHETHDGLVSVRLRAVDGGTTVELVHERAGASARGYAAGWYAHLRGLEAALAGGERDERDWQAAWETAMVVLAG